MFLKQAESLTLTQIIQIIEDLKNAELCRDAKASVRIFEPIWDDIERDPEFDENIEPAIRAELLRLAGFVLSYFGKTKLKIGFQERGKNLLFRAVEIFESLGLKDKASEAKVMLALCYWYANSIAESETILAETELEYENNQLHPVYLQICINHMMSLYPKQKYAEALKIVEKVSIPMDICSDKRLKTVFHNQAGILFMLMKDYDLAYYHFQCSIQNAQKINSPTFVGSNINNLANLLREIGKYPEALIEVEKSIRIWTETEEDGWLCHAFDTKATILLAQGSTAEALLYINKALDIFNVGDDYLGLAEALFDSFKIKLKLNRFPEAMLDFFRLTSVAREHLDEFTLHSYLGKFEEIFYSKKNLPYKEEVHAFKKSLIAAALKDFGNQISKAAASLSVSHEYLSDRLKNEFPEIYKELGFERRVRAGSAAAKSQRKSNRKPPSAPIQLLKIPADQIEFPETVEPSSEFRCFLMHSLQIPRMPSDRDLIVLCVPVTDGGDQAALMIFQNIADERLLLGKLLCDEFTEIEFVGDGEGNPVGSPDEFKSYGSIVGFCYLDDADCSGKIRFGNLYENE